MGAVNPPAHRNERPPLNCLGVSCPGDCSLREFGGFGRGLYVVALKTPSDTESRRPVFPAHSVVHLARHHGLELLKVLRISTPTP
jgi:hypothetical protein